MSIWFPNSSTKTVFCLLSVVALTLLDSAGFESVASAQTPRPRPLTTDELHDIYAGRTWQWKDGAGYFDPAGRRFTAFVKGSGDGSYAEGRWFLTNPGRFCFRATWFTADGSAEAVTCFEHRTDGRAISQRRLPGGDWYVFSHLPPRRGDEILKLKPGNRLSGSGYVCIPSGFGQRGRCIPADEEDASAR